MTGDFLLLVHESPRSGRDNMRIDWDLLKAAEALCRPVTWIRLYTWDRPTVSLGKHQDAGRAVDLEVCETEGIPVIHRPTGGRAVLHSREVTYAVVSNTQTLLLTGGVRKTYQLIGGALARGLGLLGLAPEMVRESRPVRSVPDFVSPCFVTASRYELTWRGRKIAGSAQRRLKRAFLQHGSLPVTLDYELMGRVFRTRVETLRESVCSLSEGLGYEPCFKEIRDALGRGFEEALQLGPLRVAEQLPEDVPGGPADRARRGCGIV